LTSGLASVHRRNCAKSGKADTDRISGVAGMTEEPLVMGYEATPGVEFIGFDATLIVEPVPMSREGRRVALPAPVKANHRRAPKPRKQSHHVRVCFDDREFLKLNNRAGAAGVSVPEYVRVRALRDPQRSRHSASAGDDLFARANPPRTKFSRSQVQVSPEIDKRISAYYSPENSFKADLPRAKAAIGGLPRRPKVFAKLGHFFTELVRPRISGDQVAPRGGT
jgi:hypothetical protein